MENAAIEIEKAEKKIALVDNSSSPEIKKSKDVEEEKIGNEEERPEVVNKEALA